MSLRIFVLVRSCVLVRLSLVAWLFISFCIVMFLVSLCNVVSRWIKVVMVSMVALLYMLLCMVWSSVCILM